MAGKTETPGTTAAGQTPPLAKLRTPQVSAIARAALFKQLDRDRRRQVVWVTAPAGAGKTTLAASYINARHLRHLWYRLDTRDADPATFFYYLREAAAHIAPRARRVLPLLTPEYTPGLDAFTRNFFEQLGALLRPPFLLVLDNYQELPDNASLHRLLLDGLRALPEALNLLVLSRGDPPPVFASLRAECRLASLTAESLAFTLAETRAVARRYRIKQLTPQAITNLHERIHGWAAGAVLMLEEAARLGAAPRFDQPAGQVLFDYFATEILQHMPATHRKVLLETALLPQVSAEAACALTGQEQAGHILAEFARKGYFTYPLAGGEPVYQYHPLFREFLLARLQCEHAAEDLAAPRRRAAAFAENSGNAEDAVQLWIDAGAWEDLAGYLSRAAPPLIEQGRWKTLVEWIECLPQPVRDANPCVAYWLGMALVPFDPPRARAALGFSYLEFKKTGAEEFRWRAWCGEVDSVVFEWRDFHPLDDLIDEAEHTLGQRGYAVPPALDAHVAAGMFMALMHRRPWHPNMTFWAQRAWDLAIGGDNPRLRLKVGPHLVLYYTWWIGELNKAALLLNVLRPHSESPEAPPLVQTTWCAMTGAYHWSRAENATCIDTVEGGLAVADASGVHAWDILLCSQGMFATLTSGRIELARVYAQRMACTLDPARTMDNAAYHYLVSYLCYSQGDRTGALAHVKTAVDLASAAGSIYQHGIFLIDYGRLLYYAGDEPGARAAIEQSLATSCKMHSPNMEFLCCLAKAEIAMDRGEEDTCRAALEHGLRIGRSSDFRNRTYWDDDLMARFYARALTWGIETSYVRSMIRCRNLAPPATATNLEHWPFSVKLYTLGRFTIVKDDQPLATVAGKGHKKPLELLQTLIALGGRQVGVDNIITLLWPDAEGDAASNLFKVTLHRLRKLLARDTAIELAEGRLTLNAREVWVDAWALARALAAIETTESACATDAARRVLELHRGHFLEHEPATNSALLRYREQLRARTLRAVKGLLLSLEEAGDWGGLIRHGERALEHDDLDEDLHASVLRGYLAQGQLALALHAFERAKRVYQSLNLQPPARLVALRMRAVVPAG